MSIDELREKIPAAAVDALKRGNKIEAIKLTRAASGMGLKESKDAVEALIDQDPGIKHAYDENASQAGCLPGIVVLIAMAAAIYFVFFR